MKPALLLLPLVSLAHASDLGPGSQAPPLDIKTWYKGAPIKTLAKDKTYVIEFWATWCRPCIQAMPHITKLAKANKDVTFIGVGIWEEDKGGVIKRFVQDMGSQMDYNVGYSGTRSNGMAITWMKASNMVGIPTTFIIKNGIIEWIGHPMSMEKPLQEIKNGTFDRKAFKAQFDQWTTRNKEWMAARPHVARLGALVRSGKYAEAKPELIAMAKKYPAAAELFEAYEFEPAYGADPSRWKDLVKTINESQDVRRVGRLLSFAYHTLEAGSDAPRLTEAVEMAVTMLGQTNPYIAFQAANYFEKLGDKDRATALVEKAIVGFPNSIYKEDPSVLTMFEEMRSRLKKGS